MITVIGSLKGGSGKSTTSFNIAIWLLMQDYRTAIFDLDPQQTLSDASEFRAEDEQEPVLNVFSPKSKVYDRLIEAGKEYTEVLVDIGNSNMNAVRQAYRAADRIVVPVLPSQADVWSLQRFLKFIETIDTKPTLKIVTFINRADTHHAVMETRETLAVLQQLPGISVVPKMLGQRLGFRRSFSEGLSIFELQPRSKAAAEFLLFAHTLYPARRKAAAKTTKKVTRKVAQKKSPQNKATTKPAAKSTAKQAVKKVTRKKVPAKK